MTWIATIFGSCEKIYKISWTFGTSRCVEEPKSNNLFFNWSIILILRINSPFPKNRDKKIGTSDISRCFLSGAAWINTVILIRFSLQLFCVKNLHKDSPQKNGVAQSFFNKYPAPRAKSRSKLYIFCGTALKPLNLSRH